MEKFRVVMCHMVTTHYTVMAETAKDAGIIVENEQERVGSWEKHQVTVLGGSEDEPHVSLVMLEEDWQK